MAALQVGGLQEVRFWGWQDQGLAGSGNPAASSSRRVAIPDHGVASPMWLGPTSGIGIALTARSADA